MANRTASLKKMKVTWKACVTSFDETIQSHACHAKHGFPATLDVMILGTRLNTASWNPDTSNQFIQAKTGDRIMHRAD
jgi:hypothetical protein